jgi:nucleotide-binding universal stress UspA family protein
MQLSPTATGAATRARAKAPYRRVTVVVDFTEVSRGALLAALALFPEQELTEFHAHDAPGSYGASDLATYREAHGAMAETSLRDFLAMMALPEAVRSRLALEVQFGDPARQLAAWTESTEVELVVLGTRARERVGEFLAGSVAKRALASLSCDVLLVPAQRA